MDKYTTLRTELNNKEFLNEQINVLNLTDIIQHYILFWIVDEFLMKKLLSRSFLLLINYSNLSPWELVIKLPWTAKPCELNNKVKSVCSLIRGKTLIKRWRAGRYIYE